jgi:Arc/MetJ-type ribon-helix-helix transcriptional regulator
MTIELKPETKELLDAELQTGRFRSIDDLIVEGVHALHRNDARSFTAEERRAAVRRMMEFAEKNRTPLDGVSVKELLHEGHRI